MSFFTLAISSSNHHSCVCLLEDNKVVVAFPCERTIREKATSKITQKDIDIIASYTKRIDLLVMVNMSRVVRRSERLEIGAFVRSDTVEKVRKQIEDAGIAFGTVLFDNSHHHLYHAIAGFYMSGFDKALCLVIDGIGTQYYWKGDAETSGILSETTTIFNIEHNKPKMLFQTLFKNLYYIPDSKGYVGLSDKSIDEFRATLDYPNTVYPSLDIGKMYGTITRHIGLGSSNEAGKTMGLAAYGRPNKLPPMLYGDTIIADSNFFRADGQLNSMIFPELKDRSYTTRQNLAFNVQRATEKVFVERVKQALELKKCDNLVIGGGCSLNILANSNVKKAFPSLNVFIEPIGSDASQAIGAALFHYTLACGDRNDFDFSNLFLGPEYSIVETKDKLLKLVEQYNNESSLPVSSNP